MLFTWRADPDFRVHSASSKSHFVPLCRGQPCPPVILINHTTNLSKACSDLNYLLYSTEIEMSSCTFLSLIKWWAAWSSPFFLFTREPMGLPPSLLGFQDHIDRVASHGSGCSFSASALVCVHGHVCRCTCMNTCQWRPQGNHKCHSSSAMIFSSFFLDSISSQPGSYQTS